MVAWNTSSDDIAIIAGARTPWAKAGTALRQTHVAELAVRAMQETLYRSHWSADRVDEVVLGNVVMPPDATNLARVAAMYAGIPASVPGLTVQRNCASGMEAVAEAAGRIRNHMAKAVLAGGAESMSTLPLLLPAETMEPMSRLYRAKSVWQKASASLTLRPRHFKPVAALELGLTDPTCNMIMGKTAEVLAKEFNVSRKQQDEFALRSHNRAVDAERAGKFEDERVTFFAGRQCEAVTHDIGPRATQSLEALANLNPIFDRRDGTVTVGNSCQITDGAATVLVADAAHPFDGLDGCGRHARHVKAQEVLFWARVLGRPRQRTLGLLDFGVLPGRRASRPALRLGQGDAGGLRCCPPHRAAFASGRMSSPTKTRSSLDRSPMNFFKGLGSLRTSAGTARIWSPWASFGFIRRSTTSMRYRPSRYWSQILWRLAPAATLLAVCPAM